MHYNAQQNPAERVNFRFVIEHRSIFVQLTLSASAMLYRQLLGEMVYKELSIESIYISSIL